MISSEGEQEVLSPLLEGEHGLDGFGLLKCSLGAAPTITKLTLLFRGTDCLEGKSVAKVRCICFGVPQVTMGRGFLARLAKDDFVSGSSHT